MTFNIRYASPNDGINLWQYRKEHVAETISFYNASVCGLQEATKPQVDFLESALPEYSWIGVGRDDGKDNGEFSPIFYKKTILQLLDWETIWLSETPEVPSRGWDAALPRIATLARFRTRNGKKIFYVINTHYDHIGQLARLNSSKLLATKCQELSKKGFPVIFMGDLNSTPDADPVKVLKEIGLINTELVSEMPHFGPRGTFNGFQNKEDPERLIDYIYFSGKLLVKKHATLSNTWEGLFASDHFAVMAEIEF